MPQPAKPEAAIRTGFTVITRIVIREQYQYLKEWKIVAADQNHVAAFFAANPDLGEVVKIEDKGAIMVITESEVKE